MINEIVDKLEINSGGIIAISSKTGYGIHKLKTLLMRKQFLENKYNENTNVKI